MPAAVMTTDDQWRILEAACLEYGMIPPRRLSDIRNPLTGVTSLTYDDPPTVAGCLVMRRACAVVARAMGVDRMACHRHDGVTNHDRCELVDVAAVLRDPTVECAA